MISLEQVQLLESRVSKTVDYVQRLAAENASLVSERTLLQQKMETYQKRIDELEVLVMRFKEEQSRIEDGIIAALDRLSQFEEAFENSLKDKVPAKNQASLQNQTAAKKPAVKSEESESNRQPASKKIFFEIQEEEKSASLDAANTDNGTEKSDISSDLPAEPSEQLSTEGELDIF